MSDRDSIMMDVARSEAAAEWGLEKQRRIDENKDNELYWAKDDLKKAGWTANRLRREKAKKQQQIAALQQDVVNIENELAVHQVSETARMAKLDKGNLTRKEISDKLTAEIVVHLTPLRKEGLTPKELIGDVMTGFDCGESKFWKAWNLTPEK
jgi:predicted  nucleic acid-binding Zn-ribbon protein